MERRKFINYLGKGATSLLLPSTLLSFKPSISSTDNSEKLTFGIVSDVHKDLMPDAGERLETFITKATERQVDFIIQLGDFCMADSKNTRPKSFTQLEEEDFDNLFQRLFS